MTSQDGRICRVVGPSGETAELPTSVGRLLRQAVSLLARGETVSLVHREKDLTTQQAADILNVSRPYLVRLLEAGKIPFAKTGKHRPVRLTDLLEYKRRRNAERRIRKLCPAQSHLARGARRSDREVSQTGGRG
ncbi:MAG: excisionase family DNA-binding protein [Chloroflexi bacterium]|nr:excisionase family DNA-binding protein [Chloroflexota bacterium]